MGVRGQGKKHIFTKDESLWVPCCHEYELGWVTGTWGSWIEIPFPNMGVRGQDKKHISTKDESSWVPCCHEYKSGWVTGRWGSSSVARSNNNMQQQQKTFTPSTVSAVHPYNNGKYSIINPSLTVIVLLVLISETIILLMVRHSYWPDFCMVVQK
jgi:hypothetical protein